MFSNHCNYCYKNFSSKTQLNGHQTNCIRRQQQVSREKVLVDVIDSTPISILGIHPREDYDDFEHNNDNFQQEDHQGPVKYHF